MASDNEWYTPHKYIEAARLVMGGIDLDPASCELANKTVQATKYYTKEDNGLMYPWYASSLWLNPPYGKMHAGTNEGRSWIGAFIRHLLNEYESKRVEQAIVLATAQTDATWFHMLADKYLMCFAREHVKFDCTIPTQRRDGKATHRLGTIFIYLGPNENKFSEVFSHFGLVVKAVDTPKPKPVAHELWTPTNVA